MITEVIIAACKGVAFFQIEVKICLINLKNPIIKFSFLKDHNQSLDNLKMNWYKQVNRQ